MIRRFLVACIPVVLFGCAALEAPIQNVHTGASKGQVIAFLGSPDGFQRSGEYEALRYTNRPVSAGSLANTDYNVILRQGLVVEYGYGYVRQLDPAVSQKLILIPPR